MLFEIITRGKLFAANLAIVGLLASVNTLMSYEIGHLQKVVNKKGFDNLNVQDMLTYLREGLVAPFMITFIGLFLIMHSCMLLKRGVLCKSLVA